jgi:hypothetical protein
MNYVLYMQAQVDYLPSSSVLAIFFSYFMLHALIFPGYLQLRVLIHIVWLFEIDVALVTSLRDGMNLVSYEYVACQNLRMTEGVLVLSEVRLLPLYS